MYYLKSVVLMVPLRCCLAQRLVCCFWFDWIGFMDMLFTDRLVAALRRFGHNEQGAVTIDWVILAAGIVVLAVAVMPLFKVDLDAVKIATAEDADGNTIPNSERVEGGNAVSQTLAIIKYKMTAFYNAIFD